MNVAKIKEILNAEVLTGEELLDAEINYAFGSDLMSDVMAFVNERVLLLTGLINPQVVRTAEMMDIKAIVFVRGKTVADNVLTLAKEKNIIILSTTNTMFVSCGLLYSQGLNGDGERKKNE